MKPVYILLFVVYLIGFIYVAGMIISGLIRSFRNYKRNLNKKISFQEEQVLDEIADFELLYKGICVEGFFQREVISLYLRLKEALAEAWPADQEQLNRMFRACKQVVTECQQIVLPAKERMDIAGELGEEVEQHLIELRKSVFYLSEKEGWSFYKEHRNMWEVRLKQLFSILEIQPGELYAEVCRLGGYHTHHPPAARKIFFQSHQFLVGKSREYSLKLYMHYLHVETGSEKFHHRVINKKNSAWLFKKQGQEESFNKIKERLLRTGKLDVALKKVEEIYIPPRKKINLNHSAILEAGSKQAHISELLGQWLSEDETDKPDVGINAQNNLSLPGETMANDRELLELFEQNNYRLSADEADRFARNRGVFRDQLIEAINEEHYDLLDDLLIECEADEYILNKEYYQQIKNAVES